MIIVLYLKMDIYPVIPNTVVDINYIMYLFECEMTLSFCYLLINFVD